ncbi:RNA pyrophosphohydrolase [Streptomyces acidiscabies]|nr:RNA pyrophosphohydrolase [Streptomyces acidiscabies]GAV45552.1 RNA pyrophosphohydrolase [Streptomyces acidiscabies]
MTAGVNGMTHRDVSMSSPPRRRIGAVSLVLDQDDRVLLVQPAYKSGKWQLPGGGAQEGEAPADAAARELAEETGLVREISHALVIDYMPASSETAEGYNIVVDGGTVTPEEADAVAVPDSAARELSALKWVPLDDLDVHVETYQERRIREALTALKNGHRIPILTRGEPAA